MRDFRLKDSILEACDSALELSVGDLVRDLATFGIHTESWESEDIESTFVLMHASACAEPNALARNVKAWMHTYPFPRNINWQAIVGCGESGTLVLAANWRTKDWLELAAWTALPVPSSSCGGPHRYLAAVTETDVRYMTALQWRT